MITWLPIINKFTFHHQKEYGIIALLTRCRQSFHKIMAVPSFYHNGVKGLFYKIGFIFARKTPLKA
ncbi:hypothetical protein AO385_0775 [Moraxella catarrhalis]|nr:hypothetical protein AO385_0775 [Moraxella catarrhalis]